MSNDIKRAIERLERTLAYLREQDAYDLSLFEDLKKKGETSGDADWETIRTLVMVAVQGKPDSISYMDQEWLDFIEKDIRDSRKDR